jgi:hypothetical protein
VVDHLFLGKKETELEISQGATDPFSIARMLLCTHKHGSEMGYKTCSLLRTQPFPELLVCRHKEPSCPGPMILIAKDVGMRMCLREPDCRILPRKCSPDNIPV